MSECIPVVIPHPEQFVRGTKYKLTFQGGVILCGYFDGWAYDTVETANRTYRVLCCVFTRRKGHREDIVVVEPVIKMRDAQEIQLPQDRHEFHPETSRCVWCGVYEHQYLDNPEKYICRERVDG